MELLVHIPVIVIFIHSYIEFPAANARTTCCSIILGLQLNFFRSKGLWSEFFSLERLGGYPACALVFGAQHASQTSTKNTFIDIAR